MTCYMCGEDKNCELFKKTMETAKDETDVYLFWHSCKEGCPKGYDKDAPCYPFTDDSEANPSEEKKE